MIYLIFFVWLILGYLTIKIWNRFVETSKDYSINKFNKKENLGVILFAPGAFLFFMLFIFDSYLHNK
jgi:hypothetical protein